MVDNPDDLGKFSCLMRNVFAPDYAFVPAYTKHPAEAKQLSAFLSTRVGFRSPLADI